MRIACLHTADSNAAVLDAAATGQAVSLTHTVRAELLHEAEAAGRLTDDIAARTVAALRALAGDADGVLLTCSTLGPAADALGEAGDLAVPVVRVDEALARQSVRDAGSGRLVVLYAVETTRAPTQRLFEATFGADPARITYQLVDGAWARFRAGDMAGYHATIAAAADQAFDEGATVVALAQTSMSGATALTMRGVPLTSPAAGLAAITQRMTGRA